MTKFDELLEIAREWCDLRTAIVLFDENPGFDRERIARPQEQDRVDLSILKAYVKKRMKIKEAQFIYFAEELSTQYSEEEEKIIQEM